VTDPSGERPDLLAQATTAQPMTHAQRSSRHRRRRRRRGPSTALIVGIAVVVVVVAAAAVVILTHKSSSPSATSSGNTTTDVWTYHDLDGHSVKVVAGDGVTFVTVGGVRVPNGVRLIDAARSRHDCTGIAYLYIGYLPSAKGARPDSLKKNETSAFAAYALSQASKLHCTWVAQARK
jgi:hypothetical protein